MTVNDLDVYLVGGAVRDELLGIKPLEHDWVVVGSTPEQMLALGFKQVGKDFPVYLHPDSGDEYALARTERKSGHGYAGFEVHAAPDVTLQQDLSRRDLTVNAIARDSAGNLVDPFNGQQDLAQRILRHVSDAFIEDPLRVLRAARFAARYHEYGFSIAADTMNLMTRLSHSGELTFLAAERLWVETEKALKTANPSVFFQVLEDCGAIAALCPNWHPRERELKTLHLASQASHSTAVRFAALMAHQPGDIIEQVCEIFKVPNQHRDLALLVARHGMDCHCRSGEHALRLLEQTEAWRRDQRFEDFLEVCTLAYALRGDERDALVQAAAQTASIDTSQWQAEGIKGPAMGERVRQARLQILAVLYE